MIFKLDERLESDSVFVCRIGISQIRLSKDARYPWLLLIPEITGLSELDDLSWQQQLDVLQASNQLSACLKSLYTPKKLNIAALGNIVKQLHIHHVARFEYDEAWPGPIWGKGDVVRYSNEALAERLQQLREALDDTSKSV